MLMTLAANMASLTGLSLIIGGTLALGAFTAPVLFQQFSRPEAGTAMTVIFRRYDVVLTVAFALVIIGEALRLWHCQGCLMNPMIGWLPTARVAATALLVIAMILGLFVLSPKLEALQTDPTLHTDSVKMAAFQTVHKQSEQVYKAKLMLGLILLALLATEFACAGCMTPMHKPCPMGATSSSVEAPATTTSTTPHHS
ncbi:MAG: DUF4149 domain-containing protein [Vampirovibrionales bacterium]|nr:DUF4149 domain-containing protein [Vampirovibrionales bacterium]